MGETYSLKGVYDTMRKTKRLKTKRADSRQPFSQIYEQFEGNTFVQSVIDRLYEEGSCCFSRKESLGSRIAFSLHNVGIPYEIEKIDDATMRIVIL
jgi:hypothetical protein